MFGRSVLLRRTASAWLLVASLIVALFVTAALTSALLSFYTSALPATVTSELRQSGSSFLSVSEPLSGPAASATRLISSRLRAAFGPVPYHQFTGVESNDLTLPVPQTGGNVPVLTAATLPHAAQQAMLTAGTWPAAPAPSGPAGSAGQPLDAALPAAVANRLHLGVGSVLTLHYVGSHAGVRLRISGLFTERDPAAAYWHLSPLGPGGYAISGGFASYGPAVVSPAAFGPAAQQLQPGQVTVVAVPDPARLSVADLTALAARLRAAVAAINTQGSGVVTTSLPQLLGNVAASLSAARSLVGISGLELLLLASAALALVGRLLVRQRDEETALLAARGADRWQLIRPSLAESAAACAVAAALGAVAGLQLAQLLLASVTGHRVPAPGAGSTAWLAAAVVLVLCLAIVLWPAVRPPAIAAVRIRRGRSATIASLTAAGADLAVIALAFLAVHELRTYSAATGGSSPNLVVIAAPALALAGLAIIPLRLLPLAARLLEKLTARSSGLGTAMASWEVSRRPIRQSGPALLVVLAVGTATLALAQYQSWERSVHDQAAFAAGADVRVGLTTAPPLSGADAFARLPGVTDAMPVAQQTLTGGQLLAISGRQAGATVLMRPDLSPLLPVASLWRALSPSGPQPGLAVPGRPARLAVTVSLAGGLHGQLGPVSAVITVQDGYGLAYQLPAGSMPADGKPHQLIATLGNPAGIAYPLRVLGVSLTYVMPFAPTSVRAGTADNSATVTVGSIAGSPAASGPFGSPFATGRQLAGWAATTSATGLTDLSSLLKGGSPGARAPRVYNMAAAGQDLAVRIDPGHGPVIPRSTLASLGVTSLPAQLSLLIRPPRRGVPLVATAGFLHTSGLSVGSAVPLTVGGAALFATIRQSVDQFPSVTTGNAVIVGDAALEDAVVAAGGVPLAASSWWLRTGSGEAPAGLPAGSAVVTQAALLRRLQHDPVSAAPVRAALAVAAAAAVLAALGFCVSVAASARERRGQRALLAALGVAAGDQARLFCLEELIVSGPAAVFGVALGVLLAHLLIPSITLTPTAGAPIPPALVRVPVAWVALVALVIPAIPIAAALITALRQPDPAAELRAVEAAG